MIAAACNRDLGYQCTCFTKLSKDTKGYDYKPAAAMRNGPAIAQRLQSTLNDRPFLVSGLYVDRRLAASPCLGDKSVFGTSRACPSKGASLQVDIVVDFVLDGGIQMSRRGQLMLIWSRQSPGNSAYTMSREMPPATDEPWTRHGRANHGCIAAILLR